MKSKKSVYLQMEKRTKRKILPNSQNDGLNKPKSDLNVFKLPPSGYPTDHPFNKEGYRYILAEPDPFAPFRKEFDESEDWAGKPIPGWLYRKLCSQVVLIAMHDRAPQLKVSEDRLTITGEKGYCMARATHGANFGNFYYEVNIINMPEGAASRIGWSQELANLHGPCGYDKFGYSWRSRKGTVFHNSKGTHYADEGYGQGDVIGCLICLNQDISNEKSSNTNHYLGTTYKDCPLVKVKNFLYFEAKDNIKESLKKLKPLIGSKMIFYKNGKSYGTAFSDINSGVYYPTISLYKSAVVQFNFGPNFKFAPKDVEFEGVYNLAIEHAVKQSLSEIMYFTENDGVLSLDTFYAQSSLKN